MYDVYVVGVATDAAGLAELRQAVRGDKPAILKEAMVPAFGQLDMSAEGIHIYLAELKRPLKPGETVNLSLTLDNGEALMAAAVVK
jgi:copper(I)-binding protein